MESELSRIDCIESLVPVTALHVHGDYLFIGSGNRLELWRISEDPRLVKTLAVKRLTGLTVIHGIDSMSWKGKLVLAVYGNRQLSVLKVLISPSQSDFDLDYAHELIYLGDWIMKVKLHGTNVFTILSDNSMVTVDLVTGDISKKLKSPVQCIIYSALIITVDPCDNILIVTGTPFRTASVWCCINSSVHLVTTLKHHNGAVFALEYDHDHNLLFTASDDRSINIYSHSGCTLQDSATWSSGKFIHLHRLFSHASRIWALVTLDGCLVSCGENDELCVFSSSSGKLLTKKSSNESSSLWCLAVSKDTGIIYLGSSDASVRRFPMRVRLTSPDRRKLSFASCFPKAVKYVRSKSNPSQSGFVCVTDNGICSKLNLKDDGQLTVQEKVYLGKDYESYCVICIDDQDLIYCCNRFGLVETIQWPSMELKNSFQAHPGKIFTCMRLSASTIATSGPEGIFKVWTMGHCQEEHQLHPCRHRWLNCGLEIQNFFVVGDASGNISVYSRAQFGPLQRVNSHSSRGVTDLITAYRSTDLIYSCGRDGNVIEYSFLGGTLNKLRLVPLNIDFDWIERMFLNEQSQFTLVGFSSTNFTVWQQVDQTTLWTINCGGGHRLWDFCSDNLQLHLLYVNKSQLNYISRPCSPLEIQSPFLKKKFHSAKVNCCCLLDYMDNLTYFATGGEDNNITLSSFNPETGSLRILDHCKGHISSVRGLASTRQPNGSILLVSVGGQSQMMVWSVHLSSEKPLISQIYDSHSANKKSSPFSSSSTNDPKARYLSVLIKPQEGGSGYLIAVTSSDSYLKLFSLKDLELTPIGEVKVCESTPLVLNRINETLITGTTDGYLRFWTISGLMKEGLSLERSLNDLSLQPNGPAKPIQVQRCHQSGINCIDCRQMKGNFWLIVSSGDDSILTVTLIKVNVSQIEIIRQKQFNHSHSSQISVVSILDDLSLVTCSIDQRIKLWRFSVDCDSSDLLAFEPFSSRLISAADISSSTIFTHQSNRYVIITGSGIEILRIM